MVEAARMHDDIEIDARVAKGVEANGWLYLHIFIDLLQNGFGNLDGHALDFFEVAVISDPDGNADDDVAARHAEIGDIGGSDFLIRDHYHISIASWNDGREAPGNIGDPAFFAAAQADVIADAQLFGKNQVQTREDVGQRFLQGEGYGHTTDAQGGQDGGNGNPIVLKNDEDAHRIDDAVDNGIQQSGLWHLLLRAFDLHIDDAIYGTGNNPGD